MQIIILWYYENKQLYPKYSHTLIISVIECSIFIFGPVHLFHQSIRMVYTTILSNSANSYLPSERSDLAHSGSILVAHTYLSDYLGKLHYIK